MPSKKGHEAELGMMDNVGKITIKELRKLGKRVDAVMQHGETIHQVFFASEEFDLKPSLETMVALALYPGMKTGCDLEVNGALSSQLLKAIPVIQDVYQCWYPSFKHIQLLNTQGKPAGMAPTKGTGLFFSGGMDCWYSLLKHQDEISDLIYVWGWEVHHDDRASFEKDLLFLRTIADAFHKRLIVIRTNLGTFTESYLPLHRMYGTALAGLAHMLSAEIGRVFIASEDWYSVLLPGGSSVFVDPRWSSETLEIIHDGLEVTRLGKARLVGQDKTALRTLRVCWEHPSGILNCGSCEKCLRTMINLQIVGALEECTTFAVPLEPRGLKHLTFFHPSAVIYVEENLKALEQQPWNRNLYRALRRVLNRHYLHNLVEKLYPGLLTRMYRWKSRVFQHEGRKRSQKREDSHES